MPRNKFICSSCESEWEFIGPYNEMKCPSCDTVNKPLLPRNVCSPSVFEIVDKSFNTKRRDNFEERAAERNAAGTKHTLKETARSHGEDPKRLGWTEDDPKLI